MRSHYLLVINEPIDICQNKIEFVEEEVIIEPKPKVKILLKSKETSCYC